eukprot:gene21036-3236_t
MSERKRLRLSENEAAPVPANDGSSGGGVGLQMNQMNHNISEVEATEHPQLGDDGQQRHYTLEEEAEDSHAPPPEGAVVGEVQRHPNGVQPTGNLFLLSREKVEKARLQRTEGLGVFSRAHGRIIDGGIDRTASTYPGVACRCKQGHASFCHLWRALAAQSVGNIRW